MYAKHFRTLQATILAFSLTFSVPALSSGLGWYYESFSWNAFQAYFGGGTPGQKRMFLQHLQKLTAAETNNSFYNITLTRKNLKLWESFIENGIPYSTLGTGDARFADEVIAIIMSDEAELKILELKSETNPDYINPGAFINLLQYANKEASLLSAFQFGRSYGQKMARTSCLGMGESWRCLDAYIILSPSECAALAKEIRSIMESKSFKQSEFEEVTYVTPFAAALDRASKAQRGMYIHSID
jgi:hypothetical protein